MDRRQAIKTGITGLSALFVPASFVVAGPTWINNPHVNGFGASPPERRRPDRKRFHNTFPAFKGVSSAINQNVFLFHNLQKQIGNIVPHDQNDKPGELGEGDCVGQATAMGGDILASTNIHMLQIREKWIAKASVEMVYAGSRIEIGKENNPYNPEQKNWIKGRGGSHGEWAAMFVRDYGYLHRKVYHKNGNRLDLTGYSPTRSREYRDVGVPDWLESIAREHPVKEVTNVQSGREALDAVCAGQPVLMCSSYAFGSERDAEGFATPYMNSASRKRRGRRWFRNLRVQWWHAMLLTGAILEGNREGGVIQNSHGDWNSGPRP